MSPKQMQQLLHILPDVHNTDDLLDVERRLGPFDEESAVDAHALFLLASLRCRLACGPAPSQDTFALSRAAPPGARVRLEVRGRMGNRIVRIAWAEGALFGSLYALRRFSSPDLDLSDMDSARRHVRQHFDEVLEEVVPLAVA